MVNTGEIRLKLAEGASIGPYSVVRLIGTGGMGVVYEVEHVTLGVRRALKVFNMTGDRSDGFRERFLSEGRLLARLSHPGIVRVYDLGWDEADATPWFAMDLVLGADGNPRTLADLTPGETDESQVAEWFTVLCSIIGYIHSQGVLHRDIKPGNVLVAADGQLVLSDFGISRIVREELRINVGADVTCFDGATNSRPGPVMGTCGFVAPEVLRGEPATVASDIYSLGVVFFRLLTGVWYDGSLAPGSAATDATGVDSARLLQELEYNWSEILPAMLATDPTERPRGIAEIAASLSKTGNCQQRRQAVRRRRIFRWVGAVASIAVLGAVAALAATKWLARQSAVPEFDKVYEIPESIR